MSRVDRVLVHYLTCDRLNGRAAWRERAYFLALPKDVAKVLIISFILPLILSACAVKGDFGRPVQTTNIGHVMNRLFPSVTNLLGNYGRPDVADDEITMRNSGYLLAPPLTPAHGGATAPMATPDKAAVEPLPYPYPTAIRQN